MVVSGLYVLRQPAQSLYRACAFYGNPRRACAEPVLRHLAQSLCYVSHVLYISHVLHILQ
jgi:hypothetical protein